MNTSNLTFIQNDNSLNNVPPSPQDSLKEFINKAPLVTEMIEKLKYYLSPEFLIIPIKKLVEHVSNFPIEKIGQYFEKLKSLIFQLRNIRSDQLVSTTGCGLLILSCVMNTSDVENQFKSFVSSFESISRAFQEAFPGEFIQKCVESARSFRDEIVKTTTDTVYAIPAIISKMKEILMKAVRILSEHLKQTMTEFKHHMDKDGDGKMSIKEALDIKRALGFIKNLALKKNPTTEISQLKQKLQDAIPLLNEMNLIEKSANILQTINLSYIGEFFNRIQFLVSKFNRDMLSRFIEKAKELLNWIWKAKDELLRIFSPNDTCFQLIQCLVPPPDWLQSIIQMIEELKGFLDLKLFYEKIASIGELFCTQRIFSPYATQEPSLLTGAIKKVLSFLHRIYLSIKKILGDLVESVFGKNQQQFNNMQQFGSIQQQNQFMQQVTSQQLNPQMTGNYQPNFMHKNQFTINDINPSERVGPLTMGELFKVILIM